jgi:hypothetical protein|tara:strand:+ start:652 stop:828 length:177 start_codon:yes stop_codon:yes gene_type:complete
MKLDYINLVKLIYLINAKMNGWLVGIKNEKTFYLIKDKIDTYNFEDEINKISINEINL